MYAHSYHYRYSRQRAALRTAGGRYDQNADYRRMRKRREILQNVSRYMECRALLKLRSLRTLKRRLQWLNSQLF